MLGLGRSVWIEVRLQNENDTENLNSHDRVYYQLIAKAIAKKIADTMSFNSMKEIDKNIIGDIFYTCKIRTRHAENNRKKESL